MILDHWEYSSLSSQAEGCIKTALRFYPVLTVLSSRTVPDDFLKPVYHAFCLCHSTEMTVVKITDSLSPCYSETLLISDQFQLVEKLFCLRLRDTRLSSFIWCSLFPALVFPWAQHLPCSSKLRPGPSSPLLSLHHLIIYHGNSLHFNYISELIFKFISLGIILFQAPLANLHTYRKLKHIRS